MATSDAVPSRFKPPSTRRENARSADKPRFLDHLASWRLKTAHGFASQIGEVLAFIRRNLFGAYLTAGMLAVLSLGMNLLAFAGTLKIASMVLFNWTNAIAIAGALGISIEGATKVDVAWIGAAIIVTIYLIAAVAAVISKRYEIALVGRAEHILYNRYLHHPSVNTLLKSANFRAGAPRAIAVYAKSCLSLALIPGLLILCAIIVLALLFFQPMLVAIVLVALLPPLVLYLVTGRRASAANSALKATETTRKTLMRSIIGSKRKLPDSATLRANRDEFLETTGDIVNQRTQFRAMKSIPEATMMFVTGCVIATALIVLASTQTTSERLIYLLIGVIMIRFMFGYLRLAFAQIQSIVQNLDEIRFINRTILSESVTDGTEILLDQDDEDELDDAEE